MTTGVKSYIYQSLQGVYRPEELKNLAIIICRDMPEMGVADVYLDKDIDLLSEEARKNLEIVVKRLQRHEPIQYVRGRTDFLGISFDVSPGVLIPRPETEELAEMIIRENPGCPRILDIGTGSGCIAVSLAKRIPQAEVSAWDVSEEALKVARANSQRAGTRVSFYKKDVLRLTDFQTEKYDVIVSNPPYITEAEKPEMEARVTAWEPDLALFVPNEDPLRFYRCITELGRKMLREGGKLYFEINRRYGREIAELLEHAGYTEVQVEQDLFEQDRFVKGIW